mgnify:CR=1 FL=1
MTKSQPLYTEDDLIKLLEAVRDGELKRPRPRGWVAEDFLFEDIEE